MKNSVFFIINPIAGSGKGGKVASGIHAYMKNRSIPYSVCMTQYKGHARELVKEIIKEQPQKIIACGGDGTIHEVAQELLYSEIVLGIIPIGSGNGLASHLGIPSNIPKALEVLLDDHTLAIDVGQANEFYFFSNIGFGIDAAVIHHYTQRKKRNFLGYVKASLQAMVHYRPSVFEIMIDEQHVYKNRYYFLFCSNSNEAGYGISFTPTAEINDQKLDLLWVKKLNFVEQLYFSIFTLCHSLERMKKAESRKIEKIKITSLQPNIRGQMDGESILFSSNEVQIHIEPSALKVLIPKKS